MPDPTIAELKAFILNEFHILLLSDWERHPEQKEAFLEFKRFYDSLCILETRLNKWFEKQSLPKSN